VRANLDVRPLLREFIVRKVEDNGTRPVISDLSINAHFPFVYQPQMQSNQPHFSRRFSADPTRVVPQARLAYVSSAACGIGKVSSPLGLVSPILGAWGSQLFGIGYAIVGEGGDFAYERTRLARNTFNKRASTSKPFLTSSCSECALDISKADDSGD